MQLHQNSHASERVTIGDSVRIPGSGFVFDDRRFLPTVAVTSRYTVHSSEPPNKPVLKGGTVLGGAGDEPHNGRGALWVYNGGDGALNPACRVSD